MPITSTHFDPAALSSAWTKASRVIVDWSDRQAESAQADLEMNDLLRWIRTYPQRSTVHVYLRRTQLHKDRVLQNTLQSLGCTVTMRSNQTVLA